MDFVSLGFSSYDISLVGACTFGSVVGSFAQAIVATISPDGPPTTERPMRIASPDLRKMRGAWLTLRMLLGAILGFVFGLYFVGTLHETSATFAKIWGLSFLVGYAAPKIWAAQESALMNRINAKSSMRTD